MKTLHALRVFSGREDWVTATHTAMCLSARRSHSSGEARNHEEQCLSAFKQSWCISLTMSLGEDGVLVARFWGCLARETT